VIPREVIRDALVLAISECHSGAEPGSEFDGVRYQAALDELDALPAAVEDLTPAE
jgi:hypothetical protein